MKISCPYIVSTLQFSRVLATPLFVVALCRGIPLFTATRPPVTAEQLAQDRLLLCSIVNVEVGQAPLGSGGGEQ
jgi:hypothetical protein